MRTRMVVALAVAIGLFAAGGSVGPGLRLFTAVRSKTTSAHES